MGDPGVRVEAAAVGARLRTERRSRDLTLADVAGRTGISLSTLSRLESGQRRPTLELLVPLARLYGVSLDEVVAGPPTPPDPRVRARGRRCGDSTITALSRAEGGPRAYKQVIPPTRRPRSPDLRSHEGFDWVYVLRGRLRLVLADREVVLLPGEAAEFDTRVPHWFGNAGDEPVEILGLFGPQGERAHLRARSAPTGAPGAKPGRPA